MSRHYQTQDGYRAFVNGRWMLFVSYKEYLDYINEDEEKSA